MVLIHYIDDNVFPAGKLKNVKLKNREKSFFIIINLTSAIPFTGSRERNKAVLDNSTVRNLLCSEFLWNRDFLSCPTGQALANLHGFISCCETGQNRDMGFGVSWNMRRLTWWSVSRKYLKQTFLIFLTTLDQYAYKRPRRVYGWGRGRCEEGGSSYKHLR